MPILFALVVFSHVYGGTTVTRIGLFQSYDNCNKEIVAIPKGTNWDKAVCIPVNG